jgi:transposase
MLRPENHSDIAELTRLVGRNAIPKGSVVMTMRDELGPIFEDEEFADLYPNLGQPAESPGRLALATVMQFIENLTDRQAAQAVCGRIDWKYALGLKLSEMGATFSGKNDRFNARP